MSSHTRVGVLSALLIAVVALCPTHADIYRWDNGQLILGTEGITPGPAVDLSSQVHWSGEGQFNDGPWNTEDQNLRYADFSELDLSQSRFEYSWLDSADFRDANLTGTLLYDSTLTDADLTGAVVTGAYFGGTTDRGFTAAQLYSTRSYQAKNLRGISLWRNDLTGWDFNGQDLTVAEFGWCVMLNCLSSALGSANLESANLTQSILDGVDLTDARLSGANLTDASLHLSTLTNANMTGAVVTGANFGVTTVWGFTKAQLYSTASYVQKNLQGIDLSSNDLTGWDFTGQNLTHASLGNSTLTNANLTAANLTNAHLNDSTFTNADLAAANLTNANLSSSVLENTDLTGAALKNALVSGSDLDFALFDLKSTYNQWTVFPEGFDADAAGLTRVTSPSGDFDASDVLDPMDVDWLMTKVRGDHLGYVPLWLPHAMFDLNSDEAIDLEDHRIWVKDLANTWYGDANLDGEFNTGDLTRVLGAGKYETKQYASWSEGDWNGDGIFDTADFVVAFEDGGYEQGPRTDLVAVPEPNAALLLILGVLTTARRKSAARSRSKSTISAGVDL